MAMESSPSQSSSTSPSSSPSSSPPVSSPATSSSPPTLTAASSDSEATLPVELSAAAPRRSRKRVHFSTEPAADASPSRQEKLPDPIVEQRYFCATIRCKCAATRLYTSHREHVLTATTPWYACRRAVCACDRDRLYVDEQHHNDEAYRRRWICNNVRCGCDPAEVYVDQNHHNEHVEWLRSQGRLVVKDNDLNQDQQDQDQDQDQEKHPEPETEMDFGPIDPALQRLPSPTPPHPVQFDDSGCYFSLDMAPWDNVPRRAETAARSDASDDDLTSASTIDSEIMSPLLPSLSPFQQKDESTTAPSWITATAKSIGASVLVTSGMLTVDGDGDADEWEQEIVNALSFA